MQTTIDFFNTTNEKGEKLKEYRRKANAQEELVLKMFRSKPDSLLSPEDIFDLDQSKAPLTSFRRAFTVLTNKGLLMKMPTKKMGKYGRETFTWMLRKELA